MHALARIAGVHPRNFAMALGREHACIYRQTECKIPVLECPLDYRLLPNRKHNFYFAATVGNNDKTMFLENATDKEEDLDQFCLLG